MLKLTKRWSFKQCLLTVGLLSTLTTIYVIHNADTQITDPLAISQRNDVTSKNKLSAAHEDIVVKDIRGNDAGPRGREYTILWYNPPHYIQAREDAKYVGFSQCKYSNCRMTFNRTNLENSDAVIIDGRYVKKTMNLSRPLGQIWIFAAHESPIEYNGPSKGKWKDAPWTSSYNWTMTYNRNISDIYLPYGVFKKKQSYQKRDYELISSKKSNTALMITSHCQTQADRLRYTKELSKYFNVTILGACGTKWDCGRAHIHDDCFDLLNTTYKYYLAFENALCQQYFTEKLFDNYKFDTILIARGGYKGEGGALVPDGTFISTDDFKSAKELGEYLINLSNTEYAKMLERKEMYYSPGYKEVYGQAMCDICEKMNNLEQHRKTIPDIGKWAFGTNRCRKPNDVQPKKDH